PQRGRRRGPTTPQRFSPTAVDAECPCLGEGTVTRRRTPRIDRSSFGLAALYCKPSKCGLRSRSQRLTSRTQTHYVQFSPGSVSKLRGRPADRWNAAAQSECAPRRGIGRQRHRLAVVRIPQGCIGARAPSAQTSAARPCSLSGRVARVRRVWRKTGGRERQGNRGREAAEQ